MRVAIVGGGLMGLALAYRLAGRGCEVEVFEREQQVGGLTTWHDFGPFQWDRFYHVILPSDRYLLGFLREIGLGDASAIQRLEITWPGPGKDGAQDVQRLEGLTPRRIYKIRQGSAPQPLELEHFELARDAPVQHQHSAH